MWAFGSHHTPLSPLVCLNIGLTFTPSRRRQTFPIAAMLGEQPGRQEDEDVNQKNGGWTEDGLKWTALFRRLNALLLRLDYQPAAPGAETLRGPRGL
ncbi:hypothetical protein INR49_021059 [Caranx melampygus]|nr:hypothetical protein INR49_021059 [Caranx melampygus]